MKRQPTHNCMAVVIIKFENAISTLKIRTKYT